MKIGETARANYDADRATRAEQAALLEQAFYELRRSPMPSGIRGIPYSTVIPGIVRGLLIQRLRDCPTFDQKDAIRELAKVQTSAAAFNKNGLASVRLPLHLRMALAELSHIDIAALYPSVSRGAPAKTHARNVAAYIAEHFERLTGTRPSRYEDGQFLTLLREIYRVLGIKANADNLAREVCGAG